MTFNTTKCQEIFRDRFTGISGVPFLDFKKGKSINETAVDSSDMLSYKQYKDEDIINFYYKALLSFSEGLSAVLRDNYTWATIKLYYSVYFGLRCSLLCRDIVLVRAGNYLYKFKIAAGDKYTRPHGNNDHTATLSTYIELFQRTDFFCSNLIEEKNAYQWMEDSRNIVNYKDGVFHDPDVNAMWEKVKNDIETVGINNTLTKYNIEKHVYCFSPEYAIFSIPFNRMLTVAQEVKNETSKQLNDLQKEWIRKIIDDNLPEEYVNELIFTLN